MLSVQTSPERPAAAESPMPSHIAIIMDGNGRWASGHGLSRSAGHRQGAEAVRRTVEACIERGVSVLTVYAFSSENWKRPSEEVDDLIALLRLYLEREIDELDANGVRVRFIGDCSPFPENLQALLRQAETRTRGNERLSLVIALNYGAQAEIVEACRALAEKAASGEIAANAIDAEDLRAHLQAPDLPDPDLVVRTSGEKRLSNFLLWQAAYSELVFLDVAWPDFDETALDAAIADYQARERRFGGR